MFDDHDIFPCFLELYNKGADIEQCKEDPDLYVHVGAGMGKLLICYFLKQQNRPIALAVIISDNMADGTPSFNMLYAVDPTMTGLGLGTRIAEKAIKQFAIDMKTAITKPKLTKLYITTYVDVNHIVSQKISRKVVSKEFTIIKDSVTGRPQYYYKKLLVL